MSVTNFNTAVDTVLTEIRTDKGYLRNMNHSLVLGIFGKQNKKITDLHPIYVGVQCNDNIPNINPGNGIGEINPLANGSNCDLPVCSLGMNITSKQWDLHTYGCSYNLCLADFSCDVKRFFNLHCDPRKGFDKSVLSDYIKLLLYYKLHNSVLSNAWFSAKTSTVPQLKGSDGIWTQAVVACPTTNEDQRLEIQENKADNFDMQRIRTSQNGYEILNSLTEKYDKLPNKPSGVTPIIYCTQQLALAYRDYLRTTKGVDCCTGDITKNLYGLDNLNIWGYPIKVVDIFDQTIDALLKGPEKYDNPHRALITYKENLPIGVCSKEQLTALDMETTIEGVLKIIVKYDMHAVVLNTNHIVLGM